MTPDRRSWQMCDGCGIRAASTREVLVRPRRGTEVQTIEICSTCWGRPERTWRLRWIQLEGE